MTGRLRWLLPLLAGLAVVPAVPVANAQTNELRQLKLIRLPEEDASRSGAVAFDGHFILYAELDEASESAQIHRLDPHTGEQGPSFDVDVPGLWGITYDGRRNDLYAISVAGGQASMWDVDLATLKAREMFEIPNELSSWPHWSYDAGIDGFRASGESYYGSSGDSNCDPLSCGGGGTGIATFDRDGTKSDDCEVTEDGEPRNLNFSTLVAAGDGTTYIQSEDDSTLYHVGRDCELLGSGTHPHYSESAENDSMACDTVTFPVPAIWIRDGAANAIIAYEVPGGYCPLPTKLAPVVGKDTVVGTPVDVCTRLSLANLANPLARQPVTLSAEGTRVATVTTDANGKACAKYTPRKAGKHKLAAKFAGSLAYMPSAAVGAIKVAAPAVKKTPRRPPAIAVDPPPQHTPQVVPKPAPITQLQLQPATQTQVQPHVQSQVQVQAAIVPQVQEQVQVATSAVDKKQRDLSMTRFQPRRRTPVSPLPLGAGAVAVIGMALVVRPDGALARAFARRR